MPEQKVPCPIRFGSTFPCALPVGVAKPSKSEADLSRRIGGKDVTMMLKAALAAAALFGIPAAASAQGLVLEANGARSEGIWGGEFGLGYRMGSGGFALTPVVGAFLYQGDNDRYYVDEFDNGQSRCRDSTNGQFADDGLCSNIAAKAYGRLEATYTIPTAFELGGGARLSSGEVRPYGTVAFAMGPGAKLKANAEKRYYALGVSARF